MQTRTFALVAGFVYLVIGVAGFVPALVGPPPPDAPGLVVDEGYGRLFGLFPVNAIHDLVHLGIGIWSLSAYGSWSASRLFARGLAVVFGVLTVMGVIPGLATLFGVTPLFGHDVWLHAVTALVAAYFGFRRPVEAEARPSVDAGRPRGRRAA